MSDRLSRALVLAITVAALAWPASVSSPGSTQDGDPRSERDADLRAALRGRALTDDDFARSELYTWTTREQAARLAREHRLLWATASDGALRAPYQRSLDALGAGDGDDAVLAQLLTEHPALAARRYAWTTPYGTVIPNGLRSYGPVLVRIELRDDAWHARFAPDAEPAFRVVDARGRPVPIAAVLASPERLATVTHVRARAPQGAFREVVVHGGVLRWSIATEAIRERIALDRRVLAQLRAWGRRHRAAIPRALAPFWSGPIAPDADPIALFAASMPFDTPRHRPSDAALRAMIRALDPGPMAGVVEHESLVE